MISCLNFTLLLGFVFAFLLSLALHKRLNWRKSSLDKVAQVPIRNPSF